MRVRFTQEANRELKAAAGWYRKQNGALGERFKQAINETLDRLCVYPTSGAASADGVRFAVVSIFPYVLWYVVDDDVILIHAVSHSHRQPGYWRGQ